MTTSGHIGGTLRANTTADVVRAAGTADHAVAAQAMNGAGKVPTSLALT